MKPLVELETHYVSSARRAIVPISHVLIRHLNLALSDCLRPLNRRRLRTLNRRRLHPLNRLRDRRRLCLRPRRLPCREDHVLSGILTPTRGLHHCHH